MEEFKFDYGIITYKHRFSINRSLDDYEETMITKCIMLGLEWKSNWKDSWFEFQIIYKDAKNKNQIKILKLEDWTVNIIHKGDMSINI